jgi:hypothetical protein
MRTLPLVSFIICLFLSGSALAQKTPAMIRKIQGLDKLDPSTARELERLTIKSVVSRKDLELIIGNSDLPQGSEIEMVAIESDISRQGDRYSFENRLVDVRSKNLLMKSGFQDVRGEDLIRLFKAGLEALFLPNPNPILDEESLSKPLEQKPKIESKPMVQPKKKKATTTQISQPDNYSLDFKKRVMDLQSGVDKQIVKAVDNIKEASKKEGPGQNPTMQPSHGGEENKLVQDGPDGKKNSQSYPREHRLALGYETRDSSTVHNVDTSTKVSLITVRAGGHLPFGFWSGKLAYSYDLMLGRVMSFPYEVSSPYQLGLSATYMGEKSRFSAGLLQESLFFVNLPTPGEGLRGAQVVINWMRVRAETEVFGWKLTGLYGVPISTQTNYSALKDSGNWGGNLLHLDLSLPWLVKSWETNIMMERLSLTAQGETPFTHDESRLALSARRSF